MTRLRRRYREFLYDRPGRRFINRYRSSQRARARAAPRVLTLLLGGLLLFAGLVMLITPGPGIVGLLLGGGLIAEESRLAARAMDRAELALRRFATRLVGERSR